jgi:hypothetical protein
MTLLELQVIFQSISSLAIAGGLVFTAIQFKNYRKAVHVTNYTKLVEMQMHLREMRVTDPALASVYRHDVQGLQNEREIREYFFNLMQLSVYEIVWFMYRQEQVPADYFQSWAKRMREIAAEPTFRAMMANPSMKILHDDFQAYIMDLIRQTPPRGTDPKGHAGNVRQHAPGAWMPGPVRGYTCVLGQT